MAQLWYSTNLEFVAESPVFCGCQVCGVWEEAHVIHEAVEVSDGLAVITEGT